MRCGVYLCRGWLVGTGCVVRAALSVLHEKSTEYLSNHPSVFAAGTTHCASVSVEGAAMTKPEEGGLLLLNGSQCVA